MSGYEITFEHAGDNHFHCSITTMEEGDTSECLGTVEECINFVTSEMKTCLKYDSELYLD